jgi:SAM-dependent methyltransferase
MQRWDVLNRLIAARKYKSYLEVGVCFGDLFTRIECEEKTGVDPVKQFSVLTHEMTSYDFFAQNTNKFDIVFIDGLHHNEQVYRDFQNSMDCLNNGGLILFHDCNPTRKEWQERDPVVAEWTGDCWKAFVKIRQNYDIFTCVIDSDYGIGVADPSRQTYVLPELDVDLSYENLDINRVQWLNLKSVLEFCSEFEI